MRDSALFHIRRKANISLEIFTDLRFYHEKREFNKLVKQKLLSYGFEKTGSRDYAKKRIG